MNYNDIIIGVLFFVALFYVGRKVYTDFFRAKPDGTASGCAKGCGCETGAPTKAVNAPRKELLSLPL